MPLPAAPCCAVAGHGVWNLSIRDPSGCANQLLVSGPDILQAVPPGGERHSARFRRLPWNSHRSRKSGRGARVPVLRSSLKADHLHMTKHKKPLIQITLWIIAATGTAYGQNQDFALPLGVIAPSYSVAGGPGSQISADAGIAFQINYGHQVTGTKWGDLYLEIPLILAWRGDTFATGGFASTNATGIGAFVPGARFRFPSVGRASFFVAAGGGIGWYDKVTVVAGRSLASISGHTSPTAAFDFGGGMDLRLTRLLSLRLEARDLITSQGSLNGRGHHNPIIAFGPAFHF